ncbi:TraB/GumN family protein [Deefgea tanakiae]|uniref:TraB/GumN family protein n=1 Tax=Deefgea tanakiae TaxID=2865840 RepID=A0ABX8Z6Z2_9NEIS|nr:TraB/GumN family protein [Deefgea tanakiae]QZA76684.1 TraB/GumN family protein [Deefgea tanakiae]
MFARISSSVFAAFAALSVVTSPAVLAAPSNQAILWKVEKENTPSSWLLATIPATNKQLAEFTPATLKALSDSKYIGTEFHNDINSVVEMAQTMLDDKPSLEQKIGKDNFAKLVPLLEARGYPSTVTAKLKPWAAIMMLLSPRPAKDIIPMDDRLLKYSMENSRKYFAVESVEQQLAPYQAIPADKQIPVLSALIKNEAKLEQNFTKIIAAYQQQDLDKVKQLLQDETIAMEPKEREWYKKWRLQTISQRNKVIVERLKIPFEKGDSFVGISAAQLPGKDGLLAQLRAAGYRVTPVTKASK